MKSIAALCLLGLAAAISLKNQQNNYLGIRDDWFKELDTNEDGTITPDEMKAWIEKELAEGELTRLEAKMIANYWGVQID